jgi:hypothetical protein
MSDEITTPTHNTDQALARRLAAFHRELLDRGMSEELAADLTRDYSHSLSASSTKILASLERIEQQIAHITHRATGMAQH